MVSYAWGLAVMRALKHGYKNRSTLNQNCANVQLCNLENLVTMVMVKMVKMWFGFGHLLTIIININIYFIVRVLT